MSSSPGLEEQKTVILKNIEKSMSAAEKAQCSPMLALRYVISTLNVLTELVDFALTEISTIKELLKHEGFEIS